MAWGDLNGDGALDLVAGSYDAELLTGQGNNFLLGSGAGVYLYERHGQSYSAHQLAHKSQALALALVDLDDDGRRDILVGNDFALADQAWLNQAGAWIAAEPFAATSHSTSVTITPGAISAKLRLPAGSHLCATTSAITIVVPAIP